MTVGQVVVVSDDPRTPAALAEHHDVEVVAPADFTGWVAAAPPERPGRPHVVVLEVGTPDAAREAVSELRAHARMVPALVVATADVEWERPDVRELPAAAVLPVPLQPGDLLAAVTRVVGEGVQALAPAATPSSAGRRADDPPVGPLQPWPGRTGEAPVVDPAELAQRLKEVRAHLDEARSAAVDALERFGFEGTAKAGSGLQDVPDDIETLVVLAALLGPLVHDAQQLRELAHRLADLRSEQDEQKDLADPA